MENEGNIFTFQKIPNASDLEYVRIRCEECGASISEVHNGVDVIVAIKVV
jgi:hypothetical protein